MAKLGATAWSRQQGNFQRVGAHSSAELPRNAHDPMAFHHPKDARYVGRGFLRVLPAGEPAVSPSLGL